MKEYGLREEAEEKHNSIFKRILLLIIIIIICITVGTQTFAYLMNYQSQLGLNWNKIYPPWSIVIWYINWNNLFEKQFQITLTISSLTFLFIYALYFGKNILKESKGKANKNLHGSAKWASEKDIKEMQLLSSDPQTSIFVGGWKNPKNKKIHQLRHTGSQHALVFAPTRSGKGVGIIIPTLLSWTESVVITDLKGELWEITSGWRKQYANNKVLRFEPATKESIRWNPLKEIRFGTENETGDVQNLANLIVDPDGKGLEDHWAKTAFSLLVGVILYALYQGKKNNFEPNLNYIDQLLASNEKPITELWQAMAGMDESEIVRSTGGDMLNRPEEEGGSVLSTAKSYLSLYRDPIVAENTSRSDFEIKDLMNLNQAISLYLITKPTDKDRLRPLMRIMLSTIVRILADKIVFENGQPKAIYKHKLLMMLDEFPSFGKMPIIQESMAFLAGYGIRIYLICQDLNQLKSKEIGYGQDESITSNCHIQIAYAPTRQETAEHLSKRLGKTTILKEQITTSGGMFASLLKRNISKVIQETPRPLLTPEECMMLPAPKQGDKGEIISSGDMLIMVSGSRPIYGKQILYFQDEVFSARAKIPPPETDRIKISIEL